MELPKPVEVWYTENDYCCDCLIQFWPHDTYKGDTNFIEHRSPDGRLIWTEYKGLWTPYTND